MTSKPVCMTRLVRPGHLNSNGNLFGGQLMKWIDEASFIAATRFAHKKMVTVSVDKITFRKPVPEGAIVEINTLVKSNNGIKLAVHTEVTTEFPGDNMKTLAAESWFSFACVDENDQPQRIK